MRTAGVVNQCHIRAGDLRQVVDFPGVVHAHFQHRVAMPGMQPSQHQRHADVVIEIALRCQDGLFAHGLAQDGGNHFLDRGFAIAAGQADQWNRIGVAPVCRQLSQRQPGVVHA